MHSYENKKVYCTNSEIFSYFYLYECTVAVFRHTRKGESDLITDGCESPSGCWELNSGPLVEQSVLLTAKPSLLPKSKHVYAKNKGIN